MKNAGLKKSSQEKVIYHFCVPKRLPKIQYQLNLGIEITIYSSGSMLVKVMEELGQNTFTLTMSA